MMNNNVLNNKISTKKFFKKYEIFQISLNNFLDWRKKYQLDNSKNKIPNLDINVTLEQELFLIKKIPIASSHQFSSYVKYDLLELNWQKSLKLNFKPKNIFSNKLPVIQYWIIPLCGFLVFTIKLDKNPISLEQTHTVLRKNQHNSRTRKETSVINQNKNLGILGKLAIKNIKLNNQISKLSILEKNELKNLSEYYCSQLARNLELKTPNNLIPSHLHLTSSNQYFTNKKRKMSTFHWTWFALSNHPVKGMKYEEHLVKKNGFNKWILESSEMPKKLSPFFKDYMVNEMSQRVKLQFNKTNTSKFLLYNNKNLENPIESYKIGTILLENLVKKNLLENDFSNHEHITKNTLFLKPFWQSKVLNIISHLCEQNQKSKTNFMKLKSTNNQISKISSSLNRRFKKNKFQLTKVIIQEDLDKVYFLKNLKLKTKDENIKVSKFKEKPLKWLTYELVLLKRLKLYVSKINNTNTRIGNLVFASLKVPKVSSNLIDEKKEIFLSYLSNQKNYSKIFLKNSNQKSKQYSSNKSKLGKFEKMLYFNTTNSKIFESLTKEILELKNPIFIKKFNSKAKKPTLSLNSYNKIQNSIKQTNFNNSNSMIQIDTKTNELNWLQNIKNEDSTFQLYKNNCLSMLKKQNDIWSQLYLSKIDNFLLNLGYKFQFLKNNFQGKLLKNHHSEHSFNFSSYNRIFGNSKELNSNLFTNQIKTKQQDGSNSRFLNHHEKTFKVLKKSSNFTKSLLLNNHMNSKPTQLLNTFLSSKLNLKKQFSNTISNEIDSNKLINIKKNYLNTLINLKNYLKHSNSYLNNLKVIGKINLISSNSKRDETENKLNQKRNILANNSIKLNNFLIFKKSKIGQNYSRKKKNNSKINSNRLLKQLGFIFLNQISKKNFQNSKNEGFNSNIVDIKTFEKLEQQKSEQKKHRRKKQNLETRRRKKRKRFYPRPNWLRFQAYKNFIQIRHFKNSQELNLDKSIHNTKKSKIWILNKTSKNITNFFLNNLITKKTQLLPYLAQKQGSKILQHKNETQFKFNKKLKNLMFQNKKYFNIKQRIYRNNKEKWGVMIQDKPYLEKFIIEKHSMIPRSSFLANQDFYKISNTVMSDFQRLCWKSYWLRSNLNPYVKRIQNNLKQIKNYQKFIASEVFFKNHLISLIGIDFTNNEAKSKKTHLSSNLSLGWYLNYNNSFNQNNTLTSASSFHQTENLSAYNQIIFDRLSSIIKNVKTNLNPSGQIQTISFLQGHRKNEKPPITNNWSEFFYDLISSLKIGKDQNLLINKPFDFYFNTFFIPASELTTLRILWSLNQTNLLSFKQNNDVKKTWEYLKIREQNKSNKTKKFILQNFKTVFPKNLQNVCIEKTQRIYKKLSWHKANLNNTFLNDKNLTNLNLSNFQELKFKLKLKNSKSQLNFEKQNYYFRKMFKTEQNIENLKFLNNLNCEQPSYFYYSNSFKKSQKKLVNFWWSTDNMINLFPTLNINGSSTEFKSLQNYSFLQSIIILNSLWICAVVLHLSLLFSLVRISEIRSLSKFYFLIISKMSESYTLVLENIYQFLKKYKEEILKILKTLKTGFKQLDSSKHNDFNYKKLKLKSNYQTFTSLSQYSQINLVEKFVIRVPHLSIKNFYSNSQVHRNLIPNSKEYSWSIFTNQTWVRQMFLKYWQEKTVKSLTFQNTQAISINKVKKIKILKHLTEKFHSLTILPSLIVLKTSLIVIDAILNLGYRIVYKLIDFVESFVMIIYKFLEKPAELLIDWMGQIFLIEWTSDTVSFLPDLLDTQLWKSFSKFSRGTRSNPFVGFLIQRRLWCLMEIFIDSITRPDIDLLERQKKGLLFWDIWAEVLIQAAETYKMNLSSFMTLKDEQEIFMEKILEDSSWNWSYSAMLTMSPLISFIEKDNASNLNLSFHVNLNNNFQTSEKIKLFRNSFYGSNLSSKPIFQDNKNSNAMQNRNFAYFHFSKKIKQLPIFSVSQKFKFQSSNLQPWKRWSANQSFTYQGIDTDLFVDLHPPKSFQHIQFLKSSKLAQQTLGPLVCQVYSGIFSTKIAKNILVVGSPGSAKSLFIQALAGETELKIMMDNAQRYAVVQRGVAVGMKLLRDVFDAIAMHTPCIFLMEDIHLIGERRPMLISDQENAFSGDNIFNIDQEEIHEKNQLLYQWSRHNISHYRRPYKSDFSLMIPTNHFCFDMLLGTSANQLRNQGMIPKHPLPIETIENHLNSQNLNAFTNMESKTQKFEIKRNSDNVSYLQLSKENFFTPPATSPFMIFALKEQQKVKPKKQVKQIPWGGFSFDQMNLLPKVSYSVRIKVALLADLAIRNLSVKLDMITDLLVILDNVRSNHGFVVFATTHVPSLLDPALRRPGRFDETISIPILPNLVNRWEILKTNLADFSSSVDFLDYGILTSMLTESQLLQLIAQTKLSIFNTQIPNHLFSKSFEYHKKTQTSDVYATQFVNLNSQIVNYNKASSLKKLTKIFTNSNEHNGLDRLKFSTNQKMKEYVLTQTKLLITYGHTTIPIYSLNQALKIKLETRILNPLKLDKKMAIYEKQKRDRTKISLKKDFLRKFKCYPSLTLNSSVLLSLTYFKIGTFFINANFLTNQTSYQFVMWTKFNQFENLEQSIFKQFYSPHYELKNQLIQFFSGKITELFSMSQCLNANLEKSNLKSSSKKINKEKYLGIPERLLKPFSFNQHFQVVGGFDLFWKSSTAFILDALQKRFLYQKNLIVSKILSFDDFSLLAKPSSPPSSSILMSSKKYENFQRMHFDFQQKTKLSINEKLQLHQQQRLMKTLYQKPIKNIFTSETIANHFTNFTSSAKELSYFDSIMLKSSSINAYYNNRILIRHKFSLIPQWWTAQLAEYNVETTFLSDVDWRSMFVKSVGDLVIDFPDAEQYYNPRLRRWFTNSTSWNYWLNFDKLLSNEIAHHFMIECFNNASQKLETNREILDYYAHLFLKNGVLKEIDLITIQSRFYLK